MRDRARAQPSGDSRPAGPDAADGGRQPRQCGDCERVRTCRRAGNAAGCGTAVVGRRIGQRPTGVAERFAGDGTPGAAGGAVAGADHVPPQLPAQVRPTSRSSIVASPVLVGATTVLIVFVSVFLAYN